MAASYQTACCIFELNQIILNQILQFIKNTDFRFVFFF